MSAHIAAERLVKAFPLRGSRSVVSAVNGVDIEIERGTTLGLVGESGSGKSTVGRSVLRLTEPTSGVIRHGDVDVTSMSSKRLQAHRARVQMVFQDPYESLNPRMRIRALVEEPLLLHTDMGRAERARRAAELMRLVQLESAYLDRLPHELSGGQLQRIGIARAIATDPEFLVLDEPTSSLDLSVRAGILALLERIQAERRITYLFISHDLTTVARMSDEVAVMYLGTIVEQGAAEHVIGDPQHPYTQALLSAALPIQPRTSLKRHTLDGETPSPINLPDGCLFAARCPLRRADCRTGRPAHVPSSPGHTAACVRLSDGTNKLQYPPTPATDR